MPLCIWTVYRVAVHLLTQAEFFFGCDLDDFGTVSLFFQQCERFFCHSCCDGLCREIKDPVCQPFSHCFYRRKDCGNCFAHSGRCFDKQVLPPQNGAVNIGNQLLLSLPVGKWKLECMNTLLPLFFPCDLPVCPFPIIFDQMAKPHGQCLKCINLPEIPNFLGIQIAVGHLHADPLQTVLFRIDIRIAHCLGFMHVDRLFHCRNVSIYTLDLIDEADFFFRRDFRRKLHLRLQHRLRRSRQIRLKFSIGDSVCTSFHDQYVIVGFPFNFQRYFRLVGGVHAFLNFPVDTAAFHHGLCTRQLSGTIIDISCPENKLYQISHRDM